MSLAYEITLERSSSMANHIVSFSDCRKRLVPTVQYQDLQKNKGIEYLVNLRTPSHGRDCTSQMQAPNYTNLFLHNARYLSLYTVSPAFDRATGKAQRARM